MRVGDKVRVSFESGKKYIAEVIYIHPRGRFFTAEATLDGGKMRESFRFAEPTGGR